MNKNLKIPIRVDSTDSLEEIIECPTNCMVNSSRLSIPQNVQENQSLLTYLNKIQKNVGFEVAKKKLEIKKQLLELDQAEQTNRLNRINVSLNELIFKHILNNEFDKAEKIKRFLNGSNETDSSNKKFKNSSGLVQKNDDNDILIIEPEEYIKKEPENVPITKQIPKPSELNTTITSLNDSLLKEPELNITSEKIYFITCTDDKIEHRNIKVLYKCQKEFCNIIKFNYKSKNQDCNVEMPHVHLIVKLYNYQCHISIILKRLEFRFYKTSIVSDEPNLELLITKYNMKKVD